MQHVNIFHIWDLSLKEMKSLQKINSQAKKISFIELVEEKKYDENGTYEETKNDKKL